MANFASKLGNLGDQGNSEALPSLKSLMQLKKKYDAPDVGSLPKCYKTNTDKERLYLWSADNFRRQIQHKQPTLRPLCLTNKNECGTEKLTMTFIKVRTRSQSNSSTRDLARSSGKCQALLISPSKCKTQCFVLYSRNLYLVKFCHAGG
jgi:hypothetical protein